MSATSPTTPGADEAGPPPQRIPRLECVSPHTGISSHARSRHGNAEVFTIDSDSDLEDAPPARPRYLPVPDPRSLSQPSLLMSDGSSAHGASPAGSKESSTHQLVLSSEAAPLQRMPNAAPLTTPPRGTPLKTSPSRDGTSLAASPAPRRVGVTTPHLDSEPAPEPVCRHSDSSSRSAESDDGDVDVIEPPPTLSDEQRRTMSLVVNHARSVFITGGAGTGKSFLLRKIIEALPRTTTFVTATTGIAALNLGGTTLHSFAGCGLVERGADRREVFGRVRSRAKVRKNWQICQVLIIDEVSMLDPWFFDLLDYIARRIRNSPDEPFGGIQLVLSGDFLQLPPVIKPGRPQMTRPGGAAPNTHLKQCFCFESESWLRANPAICLLTRAFRQRDGKFFQMLSEMRMGQVSSMTLTRLQQLNSATSVNFVARVVETSDATTRASCTGGGGGGGAEKGQCVQLVNEDGTQQDTRFDGYTILRPKRDEVERENNFYYNQLTTEEVMYAGVHTGQGRFDDKALPLQVRVREGCRVMLIKNFDASLGLVNGSTGAVTGFLDAARGYRFRNEAISIHDLRSIAVGRGRDPSLKHMLLPIVAFEVRHRDGSMGVRDVVVEPQEWKEMQGDTCIARTVQMPLILAYAITIHKSQGMSLTHVDIDFRNVFETGQSYVALSRCTDLEHTRLHTFAALAVQPNPIALSYYKALDHFFAARSWRRQHTAGHHVADERTAPSPPGDPDSSADSDDDALDSFTPYGYLTPTRCGLAGAGVDDQAADAEVGVVLTPAESPTMQIEALRKRILPATQQADEVQRIVRRQVANATQVHEGRLVMDVTAFFDLIAGEQSAVQYQAIFETNGNSMRVPQVVMQKLSEVAAYKLSQCGGSDGGGHATPNDEDDAHPADPDNDELLQASHVAAEALALIERAKNDFSLDVQREGESMALPLCEDNWLQFGDALPLLREAAASHGRPQGHTSITKSEELSFLLNRDPREVPQHAEILRYALFLRHKFGSQSFVLCTNSPTLAAYGLAYKFKVAHIATGC